MILMYPNHAIVLINPNDIIRINSDYLNSDELGLELWYNFLFP